MTRCTSHRGLSKQVAARARVLEEQGLIAPRQLPGPGTLRTETPAGRTKWCVAIVKDGRRRTREEAARTFQHQAFAATAQNGGMSSGMYVFLIDEALDPRRQGLAGDVTTKRARRTR